MHDCGYKYDTMLIMRTVLMATEVCVAANIVTVTRLPGIP